MSTVSDPAWDERRALTESEALCRAPVDAVACSGNTAAAVTGTAGRAAPGSSLQQVVVRLQESFGLSRAGLGNQTEA